MLARLQTYQYQSGIVEGKRTRKPTQTTALVNNITSEEKDPKNDREAMESPEAEKWWDGTVKEYDGFFQLGTWKLIKAKDAKIGAGNKPLTTKNVYKKKLHAITNEWRYRVRNCIRGFDMIPGVHYDESFSPTPTNTTTRVVLAIALWMLQELGIEPEELEQIEKEEWVVDFMFDVVQAFLNSSMDPDSPVYAHLPPRWKEYCELRGIPFDPTDLLLLGKAQYGQVDAAKRWMDMFIGILTEKGGCEMQRSKIDPCVLYKRENGKLVALMLLYVDDGFACGKPAEVKKIREHLKRRVEVLEIGRMKTHLGVNYTLKKDDLGWYYECEMRKYIMDVIDDFEKETENTLGDYQTPAAPSSVLMKLEEDEEPIETSGYRKYVGKLLYAVMKVLPDCANAVRDLSCHLSAPGDQHWQALVRFMGHLKYNYRPLKLRAPSELRVTSAFDADWATDKNDRRSISSYVTTIGGTALVNWQSKKQQTVALSSCESETMAGTMVSQDVLFVNNLLDEILGKDVPMRPSYVYGDNVASLFLAQNNSVGQRTKHIDLRHKFMNELVEKETVELRHVKSENNVSDVNSKNTKVETHKRHADRLYEGIPLVQQVEDD